MRPKKSSTAPTASARICGVKEKGGRGERAAVAGTTRMRPRGALRGQDDQGGSEDPAPPRLVGEEATGSRAAALLPVRRGVEAGEEATGSRANRPPPPLTFAPRISSPTFSPLPRRPLLSSTPSVNSTWGTARGSESSCCLVAAGLEGECPCATTPLRLACSREDDGHKDILDFLTGRAHVSDDLTVRNGWRWDGMAQRAKKFKSMAHRCEELF
jgi:hypothetical protein